MSDEANDSTVPYTEDGGIEERVVEIIRGDYFHLEMLHDGAASMRIGGDMFWIEVEGDQLIVRFEGTAPPVWTLKE